MNADTTPPVEPDLEQEDLFALEDEEQAAAYRALVPAAMISFALGLLSVLTLLSWYVAVVPIAGIVFALLARRRIQRAPTELTGMGWATAGLVLSIGLWIVGIVVLTTAHFNAVPVGYTEVTFAALQPDMDAREILPAKATDLHEKRIYITGFMYPGRQSIRIKEFLLVPTQGHCKFCSSSIVPTEMVRVKFTGDVMADFTTGRVGVGGKLLVDKSPGYRDADGYPYTLEADYLQE
jgi:hypothetical protein